MPAPAATSRLAVRNQPMRADRDAGGERAELAAHDAAQDAGRGSARRRRGRSPGPASRSRRGRAAGDGDARRAAPAASRRRSSAPRRSTALLRPPAKSPALNAGMICSLMMRPASDVGDRALQRRRDLDVDVAVVLGDRQQQAVADFLAAELPVRGDALRERGDVFGSRRRHHQDRRSARRAPSRSPRAWPLSASRLRRRQRRRLVDHAAGEDRHRHDVLRRTPAPKANRGERAAAAARTARIGRRLSVGADAGLSKLTVGGTEICASLATVKFGLGLVAEDHRREVGRHAAHLGVVGLHRVR